MQCRTLLQPTTAIPDIQPSAFDDRQTTANNIQLLPKDTHDKTEQQSTNERGKTKYDSSSLRENCPDNSVFVRIFEKSRTLTVFAKKKSNINFFSWVTKLKLTKTERQHHYIYLIDNATLIVTNLDSTPTNAKAACIYHATAYYRHFRLINSLSNNIE